MTPFSIEELTQGTLDRIFNSLGRITPCGRRTALYIIGSLAASLTSTPYMPIAPHFQLWLQNLLQTLSHVLWGLFCSPTIGFNPGLRAPKLEDFSFCSPPSKVLLICNQMLNWWFKAMPEKRYIPGGWNPGPQENESGDKSSGLRRKECSNWGGQSL